ncbi:hypothetical protein D3C76_1628930 [compost metagenome]
MVICIHFFSSFVSGNPLNQLQDTAYALVQLRFGKLAFLNRFYDSFGIVVGRARHFKVKSGL